jgi:hypothetical protein
MESIEIATKIWTEFYKEIQISIRIKALPNRKIERYIKKCIPPRIEESKNLKPLIKRKLVPFIPQSNRNGKPTKNFKLCPTLKVDKYVQHDKNLLKEAINRFIMENDKDPPIENISPSSSFK